MVSYGSVQPSWVLISSVCFGLFWLISISLVQFRLIYFTLVGFSSVWFHLAWMNSVQFDFV